MPVEILRDLLLSTASLVIGAIITLLVTAFQRRTATLTYSVRMDRIALAAEDPVFGAVRLTWREMNVRNLHMAVIEIDNPSGRDFEDVTLKVYTNNETVLLSEHTSVVGTPYIVSWSPEFLASVHVAQGQNPTSVQLSIYNHSREYRVPVFNRDQSLHFNILCTRPGDDLTPMVYVSTILKGGRLIRRVKTPLIFGVPVGLAAIRGIVVALLALLMCGLFVKNIWMAAALCMSLGLCAQMVGAFLYKVQQRVKRLISG